MNILHVLEQVFDPQVTDKQWKKPFTAQHGQTKHMNQSQEKKKIGSGFYSKVYKTDDPHVVSKRPGLGYLDVDDKDGYWIFIKEVVDHKLWEGNPYFPRVYSFKRISDPKQREAYSVKLETLQEFNDTSKKELEFVFRKLFGLENFDEMIKSLAYAKDKKINEKDIQVLTRDLIVALIKSNGSNIATLHTGKKIGEMFDVENFDPKLLEATKILHSIQREKALHIDYTSGNIMIRRGTTGIQPVIVDPFI